MGKTLCRERRHRVSESGVISFIFFLEVRGTVMDETRAQCLRLVWPSKRAKEMNRFSPFFSSESDVWSPARLMHLSGLRCIFKGLMKRILSKSGLMTILSKKQALYNLYIIKNHCCIINKLDRQNSIINRKNYQYISKWSLSFFTSVFLFLFNVQPQRLAAGGAVL